MKDNHVAVLLEDINHKFDLIVEMYQDAAGIKKATNILKRDTGKLKLDARTTQAAVKATNKQVHDHEKRITTLETI